MIKIEIKSISGSVLFSYEKENNTIKDTLIEAVKSGADLSGAYLSGAYLSGAYLSGAYLSGAYLSGADLSGADLSGADLIGAYLSGAYLRGADLRGADLSGAYLSSADLRGADLSGADLRGAYLSSADLRGAYLRPIKNDLFDVLLRGAKEIPALKAALIAGEIDGSTYDGPCACLCGTLEKSKDTALASRIHDQRDSSRPIERFFLGINKGDTPETSQFSKVALEWIEEFEQLLLLAV